MSTLEPDDGDLRKMLDDLDFPPIADGPVGVKAMENIELINAYNETNRTILRDEDFYRKVAHGDGEAIALRDRHDALLVELHERGLR